MIQPIKVRDYEPGDELKIVELLQQVFNGWPHFDLSCTSLEHWKWKYLDTPYKQNNLIVATDLEKIICSDLGFTRGLYLYDRFFWSDQGTDLAVHPDYRGKGIWTKTKEYKNQLWKKHGQNIAWGVTGNPIVFNSYIKQGSKTIPKVNTLLRVNDIDKHFKMRGMEDEILKKTGAKVLKEAGKLSSKVFSEKKSNTKSIELIEVNSFDDSYQKFWEKARKAYDFVFDRSNIFMNWRYLDKRSGNFKIIVAKNGFEWLGYIIYKINRYNKDYPEARIADILTLPKYQDVMLSLILEVNRRVDVEGVNALYSWAIEGTQYLEILKENGYIDSRYVPFVTFQKIELGNEWDNFEKIKPEKALFHHGDIDSI